METLFQNKYRIKSNRRPFWDYSRFGWYFITICTRNKEHYFGKVINGEMKLNNLGDVANQSWLDIPNHFPHVDLDEFIIMPNHVHGIIIINLISDVETQNFASLRAVGNKFGPQSKNLGSIIRGFKIGVKKYSTMNDIQFYWQSNYYDHIIRDDDDLKRIRRYIVENPQNWDRDRNNPEGLFM